MAVEPVFDLCAATLIVTVVVDVNKAGGPTDLNEDVVIKGCIISGNYMDINECFIELPNFQLTVDAMAVESVEFKDDCLRACLRSYLRGKTCAGLEHRPKDNACVLSERTGERKSNGENKKGSYFENVCARPQGQTFELFLFGYRRRRCSWKMNMFHQSRAETKSISGI
ncbi:hypothetical protein Q1695_015641 [Nippostrongylus brasiliensis]|nr:hypothetical protein Q1695_015641 [Nippostrongylus brasiliensis]